MSLKAFHVIFVTVSLLFSGGFAAWCWREYSQQGGVWHLRLAVAAAVAMVLLVIYGVAFLKKIKRLSAA